jgi:hypothetical protein
MCAALILFLEKGPLCVSKLVSKILLLSGFFLIFLVNNNGGAIMKLLMTNLFKEIYIYMAHFGKLYRFHKGFL